MSDARSEQDYSMNSSVKNILEEAQEEQERPYKCACGKTYLSAPALYTHVKIKHQGVAPGPLVKPTNPPIHTKKRNKRPQRLPFFPNAIQQDSDCAMDVAEQAKKLIKGVQIKYNQQYIISDGQQTCQDMATKFLTQLANLQPSSKQIIKCFFNCLKQYLNTHAEANFWQKNTPDKIAFHANQFIKNYNAPHTKMWPIQKGVVTDLIYLLCKWMFRRKWTTNKLIKRLPPNVVIL